MLAHIGPTITDITINVDGNGSVLAGGGITMDGALNATNGGGVSIKASFRVGHGSDATASFDDGGSDLRANSAVVGHSGHTGTLTIRNDAAGMLPSTGGADFGTLEIADSATAGATGHVNVLTAAELSVKDVSVATAGGATTEGTLTVAGQVSKLTQTGDGALIVGHASEGKAEIHIDEGGQFTTGTGGITVNATGLIEISGSGILFANADVLIDGGMLTNRFPGLLGGIFELATGKTLNAANNVQLEVIAIIRSGQT